jgi:hypothetical protein
MNERNTSPEVKERIRERNRRNWEELKADPLALAAYNEKKAARRKTPEGREKNRKYQREYQRKRRANALNNDGHPADNPGS